MLIISIEKAPSGVHTIEEQSWRTEVWMDGYVQVPPELRAIALDTGGYCDLKIENDKLIAIIPTEKPVEQPEPIPVDPAEQRFRDIEDALVELAEIITEVL